MNSSNYSRYSRYECYDNRDNKEILFSLKEIYSCKHCTREETMTRGKRVIYRMGDKWCYPSCDLLWIRSELRKSEIYNTINTKNKNNSKKYSEGIYFFLLVIVFYSYEPDSYQKYCSPKHDEFTCELDNSCSFRSNQ